MFARQIARTFSTTAARMSHGPEGVPGANLPFSINNRYTLLAGFIIYLGSGAAAPYFAMRYQLVK